LTFSEKDKLEVNELLNKNISWCELYKYALYNKVVSLVWHNLKSFNARNVPKYIKTVLEFTYVGHKKQNEIYLKEAEEICKALNEEGITTAPVKGAMLVNKIFKDQGIRALGDLDFLFKKEDEAKLNKIMKQLGYNKGTYDSKSKCIIPVERKEDIAWKVGATNVFPYLKLVDSEYMSFVKIDFRHSLEDSLNSEPINEMVDYLQKNGEMNPAHVLIHLAAHLFHEAFNSMSVLYNKDINLIKFCDIREFVIQFMDNKSIDEAIEFSKKYNLEEAFYYTVYHLKLIYNDGFEYRIMKDLKIKDASFVNQYVDHISKETKQWKKDFFERMFSSDNMDELEEVRFEGTKTF
jgi:hypothetical protein